MRRSLFLKRFSTLSPIILGGLLLAGCEESGLSPVSARSTAPIPPQALAAMEKMDSSKEAPILIRAYKKEAELEIWKMKADGRYALFKSYPMCRWSGQLGPKMREGDRQVPEGFYSITPAHMNPNSAYYLSFDVGYPNAYDRAWDRTGGSIMVHGICSSAGCFSMTDGQIAEIYAVVREAFAGGQRTVQMQSYPFRMTAENLAKYRLDPNIAFWKQLKEGSDNFEVTKKDVAVGVCNRRYVFNAVAADGSQLDPTGACPPLKHNDEVQADVVQREKQDEAKIAELAAGGVKPIHTVYTDGGQHPNFASLASFASRPDALANEPVDVALNEGKTNKPKKTDVAASAKPSSPAKPSASKVQNSKPAQGTPSAQSESKPAAAGTVAAAPEAEKSQVSSQVSSWLKRLWGDKPAQTPTEDKAAAVVPVETTAVR